MGELRDKYICVVCFDSLVIVMLMLTIFVYTNCNDVYYEKFLYTRSYSIMKIESKKKCSFHYREIYPFTYVCFLSAVGS